MYIDVQTTPNPNSLKFTVESDLPIQNSIYCTTLEEAKNYPLATDLLKIPGIVCVFISNNFITITKSDEGNFDTLKPQIVHIIIDYIQTGKKIISENIQKDQEAQPEDSPIVTEIKNILNEYVRPAVAMDGGDIIYRNFVDGVVVVELYGACSGCPSALYTLKDGVQRMLCEYIPEVQGVEALNMEDSIY